MDIYINKYQYWYIYMFTEKVFYNVFNSQTKLFKYIFQKCRGQVINPQPQMPQGQRVTEALSSLVSFGRRMWYIGPRWSRRKYALNIYGQWRPICVVRFDTMECYHHLPRFIEALTDTGIDIFSNICDQTITRLWIAGCDKWQHSMDLLMKSHAAIINLARLNTANFWNH